MRNIQMFSLIGQTLVTRPPSRTKQLATATVTSVELNIDNQLQMPLTLSCLPTAASAVKFSILQWYNCLHE